MEKEKGHGNTSWTPPYPKKRVTLIHPPYSHFSKRKRRLEICYFKTAVWLLYFVLARDDPAAETTVFLFPSYRGLISNFGNIHRHYVSANMGI